MLAFATAITDEATYESVGLRGIRRVAELDSVVLTERGLSLAQAYNRLLERAGELDGLEALVLLHQDTELRDPAFMAKVRARLADPDVAIVGALGVRGVRSGAVWMPGHVGYGRITEELFGLERPLATGNITGAHEVEALDGFLLVLSPWAVRNLRFDPAFDEVFHNYDLDISFQARSHGKKLVVEQMDVVHRRRARALDDSISKAVEIWRRKWRWEGPGGGLGQRSATTNGERESRPAGGKSRYELLMDLDRRRAAAVHDELVGPGTNVLDLGCGSGETAARLVGRGCSVVGVEVDPDLAQKAEKVCERVIVEDLQTFDPTAALGEARFDVITVGGVLGRLERPERVLERLRPYVAEDGYLLVRMENTAHARLRMSAVGRGVGEPDTGSEERAPLTRHTAVLTVESAGYAVGGVKPIEWNVGSELVYGDPDRLSTEMLRLIVSDPDARATGYLIAAHPAGRPTPPVIEKLIGERVLAHQVRSLGIATAGQ